MSNKELSLREQAAGYLHEIVYYQQTVGEPAIYGEFTGFATGRDDIGILMTPKGNAMVPLVAIIRFCKQNEEAKAAAFGTPKKDIIKENPESKEEKSSDDTRSNI